MEVHPGVFVSSTSTDDWRADPEVGGGAEEHVLSDTGDMRAGLSRFTADADPDPPPWVTAAGRGPPGARGRSADRDRGRPHA